MILPVDGEQAASMARTEAGYSRPTACHEKKFLVSLVVSLGCIPTIRRHRFLDISVMSKGTSQERKKTPRLDALHFNFLSSPVLGFTEPQILDGPVARPTDS